MWLGKGRSIRAGKVMGRPGGCQRGWNLARGHREAMCMEAGQPRVPTCPGFPTKKGALLREPTACPQHQGAAPTPRDRTETHTRLWRNRDKGSSNGKDADARSGDGGRGHAER